jgi:Bacterial PH domain
VSTQQEPARQGDGTTGSGTADGVPAGGGTAGGSAQQGASKVFRLTGPVVLWWAWVIFAVANLVDLAIQGHDRTSFQIAVGLAAITGGVYACALRPRVITDADGLTVLNPVRRYRVPWSRVSEIYLGESVQVHCSPVATASGKVVHSWALYSPRRSRLRAEVRGRRWDRNLSSRPGGYDRLPAEAREAVKQHPAELIAREIQSLAQKARQRGTADGPVVASWAWSSLAAVMVPVVALVLVIVIR